MRYGRLFTIRICLVFLLLPVNACFAAQPRSKGSEINVTKPSMTQEELQAAVISYANRFCAIVGQAAFKFEKELPTPDARFIASARKVYSLSSIAEIAAGPQPGAALLDLVVIATLNRIVWEDYWRPHVGESKLRGIMGEVQATLDRMDGSFVNLQKTTSDAQHLLTGAEKTGLVFQNLVQSVDQLATKFRSTEPKHTARPFDIKDYSEILTQLQNTVQRLNELVNAVHQTSSPMVTNIVDQINNAADKRVDHVFWRLV